MAGILELSLAENINIKKTGPDLHSCQKWINFIDPAAPNKGIQRSVKRGGALMPDDASIDKRR